MRGRSAIVKHQLIVGPLPIIIQYHGGIVGFAGFLGPAALELHSPVLQQRGGNGFCESLFLRGEKFVVFPEDKTAAGTFTEKALFTLGDSTAAAGTCSESIFLVGIVVL